MMSSILNYKANVNIHKIEYKAHATVESLNIIELHSSSLFKNDEYYEFSSEDLLLKIMLWHVASLIYYSS